MRIRNRALAAAAGALFALSGCGAIAGLVPDQTFRDPLKLNGVSIRAIVGDTGASARAEQLSGPYPNLSSLPLTPRDFRIDQPIRSIIRVKPVTPVELPPTVTLRNIKFTLTVTDTDGRVIELPPAVLPGPIVCTRIAGTDPADYEMTGGPYVLSAKLGDKKDALLSILQGGGENTVKGVLTYDVESNPTLPNGTVVTFWFEEGQGVASF